jgi:hypothetical protein
MPFKGLFINKGNIRVWFTTDERRIPVRMKAKVIIGAITADLVNGFPPGKGTSLEEDWRFIARPVKTGYNRTQLSSYSDFTPRVARGNVPLAL